MPKLSLITTSTIVLCIFALTTRLVVITWGMPYKENYAHEHSLFYDSRAVVHDQYRALYSLYAFPSGFAAEATKSYMPLLQRWLAAPPLALWFWSTIGASPEAFEGVAFAVHSYKVILVNRLLSLTASIGLLALLPLLLKKWRVPSPLILLLGALLVMNPTEIGLSIHEKTITLLTLILALEFYWLCRWYETLKAQRPAWRYLFYAAVIAGAAGGAREQGLFFSGLLLLCALLWSLVHSSPRGSMKSWRLGLVILGPLLGLALSSFDFVLKWRFWYEKFLDPHRPWDFSITTSDWGEMWYLGVIVLGGSSGVGLLLLSWGWLLKRWRLVEPPIMWLLIWLPSYVVTQLLYPEKAPRFMEPVLFFGLLLIGYAASQFWLRPSTQNWQRRLLSSFLFIWFLQTIVWGASALAFFSGGDNRIQAANDFQATVSIGTSVGKFYSPIHDREIPIDPDRYDLYWYETSKEALIDERGNEVTDVAMWPEYLLVQYETNAYVDAPYNTHALKWRQRIVTSNHYTLLRTYPPRTWHRRPLGVFGTHSRWAYLNPVVEVYRRQ